MQELIDSLDAIIGDLREFESEGYPAYLKQMKKANTGDSEGLYDLLDVVGQILEDLEEHQSETYRCTASSWKNWQTILADNKKDL